ncbi:nucleolar complex-associated protein 3 [Nannizzia gypsea CBS 118893]|uniref:Nucleolar complex-associated protein 3 n=1 Tax=Arthroderma gypseum (strain ATCC MYA-4604 / CBS 118893) TaxID=535722 RepID=E4V402_ARTGP|nr:nucleolar complex-associated protein 3 [Nannizzia gypsea CBS 118893]EFR04726.1 nucleolar complex-associated protein 3 [Nannizzia gypsea CBS 118893]
MAAGVSVKRRRLSPSDDSSHLKSKFYSQAAQWDLEQDYEQRPRKTKKDKEKTRLPIKTQEGTLEHLEEDVAPEGSSEGDIFSSEAEDGEPATTIQTVPAPESSVLPKIQILEAKEALARIASLINEEPEEHMELFKKLTEMTASASLPAVKKLALATQAAVYKDVIPGYRIRPLEGEELTAKVSKEVKQLRAFEQSLLSGYREYVQQLATLSRAKQGSEAHSSGLKSLSINCACSLLTSVPHFNFRGELLKILVGQLGRRQIDADFVKCRDTMEEIFSKDDDGTISLEAVTLLAKTIKAKEFRIRPSVLDTFLHLRLLSEFSSKGSKDAIDKDDADETNHGKKPKQKREFRTKKERKLMKERKVVEKDMKEADALVSHEHRDKMQAETLKLVFTTYFRTLKTRNPELVGAVLEGLAKFSHLINQDFFGDLLEVLRDLISRYASSSLSQENEAGSDEDDEDDEGRLSIKETRNATRDALLCSTTAFALLEGQDASKAASSLHLDLSFFIGSIYQSLHTLSINPDIEFHPSKSLRLPDPNPYNDSQKDTNLALDSTNLAKKVDFQTPTVLLIRCLQSILTAKANKAPPPIRIAGFTKRLMSAALQLPEKSALAVLSLLTRAAKLHGRKIAPLWNTEERKGDGVYDPNADDVERSNVFAATVWEGELLRLHYCPQVRDAAKDIEKAISAVK